MAIQVAVCGPARCTSAEAEQARHVGELLARAGATVLCGGGPGVMAAAARGARSAGGLVVAVRPDDGRAVTRTPDEDFSAVVMTGMGQARNVILVLSADAVIAVGGSWGTLSEVALAMRRERPVVVLGGWRVVDPAGEPVAGPVVVTTPAEAVRAALEAAR
ncbi:TIGR00725 family protein [Luedemannella helvata]|uniref:TIGR00725 family protein n=1 Tax=Luedemannella helvata TaxID=349315 RepID=A0ABN2JYL0_9ACTN